MNCETLTTIKTIVYFWKLCAAHLPVSPSSLQTLPAELLQMLGGLLQLLRPLLASLLQRPAVFFNPLEQVTQSQGQHPQVGDGHSGSLRRCGGSTWQGRTVGLLPESHQDNRQLQDSSSAHDEDFQGTSVFTGLHCKSRTTLVPRAVQRSQSRLVLGEPRWSAAVKV